MEAIDRFLSVSSGGGWSGASGEGDGGGFGWGSGWGSGCDWGSGCGGGSGDGCGRGSGFGRGSDEGWGSGCGSGFDWGSGGDEGDGGGFDSDCSDGGNAIKSYNGHKVYYVDFLATIIYSVKNNIANGAIVRDDLTLDPCYIVKVGDCFAHGETSHDAYRDALAKFVQNEPIEERVKSFVAQYPDFDKKIPCKELYDWHNLLTGSCSFGRRKFAAEHGIDIENDSLTVKEFVELAKDSYEGNIIKQILNYEHSKNT